MKNDAVRLRFAPSPTGGLHLGGVRTALFSYLFAKNQGGSFILRIEDTDRNRFVEGAEDYIKEALDWCGIIPDEGPAQGGDFGPYRQSERKSNYKQYADQLIEQGHAYYAFDTKEELEEMRNSFKSETNPSPQYDKTTRGQMKNSLNLSDEEVQAKLTAGEPYVVRIKVPENESIGFHDLIRGDIKNDSNLIDDKVILKGDGMPTYHLAVVVDDYLMKVSHVFRGEEWLPSAPIHILLWKYLGWENEMPAWAHLPLIMKPDGKGKLSKRDGERLGFPVFPLTWETHQGFRERGFLAEAFVNMLAMLGWNDGSEQELFSKAELIEKFEIGRVHKAGAKFNYEKALWFNQEWLKNKPSAELVDSVRELLNTEDKRLLQVIDLVKERCSIIEDFKKEAAYFFHAPESIDVQTIQKKWNPENEKFYTDLLAQWKGIEWNKENLEHSFKALMTEQSLKMGAVMLPFRIMLVGGKYGPGVFDIAHFLGFDEVEKRVQKTLSLLQ